jgi:hypothetical protein
MKNFSRRAFLRHAVFLVLAPAAVLLMHAFCGCRPSQNFWAIDDLSNPGRGWTSFYCFDSDSRNGHYPESTIAYYRFTWRELEPQKGAIDFALLDALLEAAAADNQGPFGERC